MKFNWKKFLWIDKRVPKRSYVLRTLVGFYLIYIVYQIIAGMKEPNVTKPAIVIVAAIILSFFCVFCLLSGGIGLYTKEYNEAQVDEEDERNEEDKPNDEKDVNPDMIDDIHQEMHNKDEK